jgi:integrase
MGRHGRRRHDFLQRASVKTKTLRVYADAMKDFTAWARQQGLEPRSDFEVDDALDQYIHFLFIDGGGAGRQRAANTVAAVPFFLPRTRRRLHASQRALKGWARLVPSRSHPPMPWSTAVVLAISLVFDGELEAAVALLVSHRCYLRVSEMASVQLRDVDAPVNRDGDLVRVGIRLRRTKTGQNKWVRVSHPAVARLVYYVLTKRRAEGARPSDLLFATSAARFRRLLASHCARLGLRRFTPHSLRHGGATTDYMEGVNLENILVRGRWKSTKSARHYIQSGRALLMEAEGGPRITAISDSVGPTFDSLFIFISVFLALSP